MAFGWPTPSAGVLQVRDLAKALFVDHVLTRSLTALRDAGLIEFSASKPLYLSLELKPNSDAPARGSAPNVRGGGSGDSAGAHRRAEVWITSGAADEVPAERLAAVIAEEFNLGDVGPLVALALERREPAS